MNKKGLILAGVAICTSLAVFLGGCGRATDAAGAASVSVKAAQSAESVVAKLDTVAVADFKFPASVGNDFFVAGGVTNEAENGVKALVESVSGRAVDGGAKKRGSVRRVTNSNKYKSKHFDTSKLNENNTARNAYLDKVDDLYVLCADIVAANNAIAQTSADIKSESIRMKQTSVQLKAAKTDKKDMDLKKFNDQHARFGSNLNKLSSDKNNVKKRVKKLPKAGASLDVDAANKRYLAVMGRLETRLKLLDAVKTDMQLMNQSLCEAAGTCAPIAQVSGDTKTRKERIKQATENGKQNNWFRKQQQKKQQYEQQSSEQIKPQVTEPQATDSPNNTERRTERRISQPRRPHRAERAPQVEVNEPTESVNTVSPNVHTIKIVRQPVNNLPITDTPKVPEVENQTPQVQKTLSQAS